MKEKARKLKVRKQDALAVSRRERQSILGGGSCVLKRRQMLSAYEEGRARDRGFEWGVVLLALSATAAAA